MGFQVNLIKDRIYRIARSRSQNNQVVHSLIVSFWLKEIVVKIEFQINQSLRRSISEVKFCLSLQNLLCKALNQSLFCKYCKEGTSVVTHFWIPRKKKRETQNNVILSDTLLLLPLKLQQGKRNFFVFKSMFCT